MPKYYCDYCDTFLTHDSPSVRKTHCNGRKHKENVRFYYQKWMEEQAQNLIDATTAAFKANKALAPPPFAGIKPPNGPPILPQGLPPGIRFPPGAPPPIGLPNRLPLMPNVPPPPSGGALPPPGAPPMMSLPQPGMLHGLASVAPPPANVGSLGAGIPPIIPGQGVLGAQPGSYAMPNPPPPMRPPGVPYEH
ncbi:hypothetical protein BLOT_003882 [Blomia tropicalis]|nr:hypothetical protein BLOT_003882 [Blomia tropicalis]